MRLKVDTLVLANGSIFLASVLFLGEDLGLERFLFVSYTSRGCSENSSANVFLNCFDHPFLNFEFWIQWIGLYFSNSWTRMIIFWREI
jgi:hypothetical protein